MLSDEKGVMFFSEYCKTHYCEEQAGVRGWGKGLGLGVGVRGKVRVTFAASAASSCSGVCRYSCCAHSSYWWSAHRSSSQCSA